MNLTPKEIFIAKRLAEDAPAKSIAAELGVTLKAVEYHRTNLFRKLNCGLAGLTRWAIKTGLTKL